MANSFDAYEKGVTRNPYHPIAKQIIAINFDLLTFKLDGEEIPAANVLGAFPQVECLVEIQRNSDGSAKMKADNWPDTRILKGKVEVIGTPLSCGCSASKFKVPQFWDVKLDTHA